MSLQFVTILSRHTQSDSNKDDATLLYSRESQTQEGILNVDNSARDSLTREGILNVDNSARDSRTREGILDMCDSDFHQEVSLQWRPSADRDNSDSDIPIFYY